MRYTIPTPFTFIALPYLIIGVFLEAAVLWLMGKKYGITLRGSFMASLFANAFTAFAGLFVVFGSSFVANIYWFIAMFLISVVVETAFWIAYYSKREISKLRFLLIATIGNLITFLITAYGIFLHTGLTEKYLNLLGISFS